MHYGHIGCKNALGAFTLVLGAFHLSSDHPARMLVWFRLTHPQCTCCLSIRPLLKYSGQPTKILQALDSVNFFIFLKMYTEWSLLEFSISTLTGVKKLLFVKKLLMEVNICITWASWIITDQCHWTFLLMSCWLMVAHWSGLALSAPVLPIAILNLSS